MNRKNFWMVASALGVVLGVNSVLLYLRYWRETKSAIGRLHAGSHVIETSCGPIEYAVTGNGPPVLASHGGGGGYDQGLQDSNPVGPGILGGGEICTSSDPGPPGGQPLSLGTA